MKKVFISYCWNKYDEWVESLAVNLSPKYNVIFDKWEIKHGHNLDLFMENSIRDADKVLIICESEYALKANKRISGVGVETSIISSKVYRNTKQEKFIPVFLEGLDNKPDYMESILGIEVNPNQSLDNIKIQEFERAILGKTILEKPQFKKTNLSHIIETSRTINIPHENHTMSLQDKMQNNVFDVEVYNKILKLLKDELISKYIVKYKLKNFGKLVLKFEESNQIKILDSISNNYAEATGYGGWSNYDLFGKIAYDVAIKTSSDIREMSIDVLKNCAEIRYNLQSLLDDVNL